MTKKKIIFSILELFFMLVLPLVLVAVEYVNIGSARQAVSFKLGFMGVVLLMFIFIVFKKTFLNKKLKKTFDLITRYEGDIKTKVNVDELENIARELKRAKTVETLINSIMPFMVLILGLIMCKGLEQEVVKLSGVIGFMLLSFVIGTIFSVLSARQVTSKHLKKRRIKLNE